MNVFVLGLAFLGVFVMSGLFALLIATRQWHWFVRAVILIVSVLQFLLVEASDLMLILLVSQFCILLAVLIENSARDRNAQLDVPEPNRIFFIPKFRVLDLLLAVVIACAVSALLSQATQFGFLVLVHLVGIGVAVGVWSLAGVGVVYSKIPWKTRIGMGLLAMTGSLIWAALDDHWLPGLNQFQSFVSWLVILVTIGFFVLAMFQMFRFSMPLLASRNRSLCRQPSAE